MKLFASILAIVMIALAFILPISMYLMISMPVDTKLNQKFGSHASMAYDQATFEGMKEQLNVIWTEMNNTWKDVDAWSTTYNTWWGPDQAYDNSLMAQNDYFKRMNQRLDNVLLEQDQILNHNKTIMTSYNQWYQQALNDTRIELKRSGGILWVITPAYYLSFAPLAYWGLFFYTTIFAIFFIIGCILLIYAYVSY